MIQSCKSPLMEGEKSYSKVWHSRDRSLEAEYMEKKNQLDQTILCRENFQKSLNFWSLLTFSLHRVVRSSDFFYCTQLPKTCL